MAHEPVQRLKVGQIWADNDPRTIQNGTERHLKIVQVLPNGAACRVTQHINPRQIGRLTVIRADRFKPNKTGYRLIQDAS